MSVDPLSQLEFHHLRALDALLQTGSVTRAAERLRVTQSAVSHSLRHLRQVLEDPLLVRSGEGLVLTPRAELLKEPLRRAILGLGEVLSLGSSWDPATSTRSFLLVLPEWYALPVLSPLLKRLAREAPGVNLDVRSPPEGRAELGLLALGADLAVGVRSPVLPGIRGRTLFEDDFVCLARKNHPLLRDGLDLDRFLSLDHALMSPQGTGPAVVDTALELMGKKRRVMLKISYFMTAPHLVAESDLLLTAPRSLAFYFLKLAPLEIFEAPLVLPGLSIKLLWPERLQEDPGHRWLRGVMGEDFRERG